MQKLINLEDTGIGIPLDCAETSYRRIAEIFKCVFCNKIAYNPKSCECHDIYCRKCFSRCLKCNNDNTPKDIGNIEMTVLGKIKISCLHRNKGCPVIIEYEKYKEHLDIDCYYNFRCTICEYTSNYKKISSHVKSCDNKNIEKTQGFCLISNEENTLESSDSSKLKSLKKKLNSIEGSPKFDYFEDVNQFFDKSKCKNCDSIIPLKQHKAHYLKCPKYKIKCNDCSTIIQKKNFPFHNDGQCFMKMILFYESNRKAGIFLEKQETKECKKLEELKVDLTKESPLYLNNDFLKKKRLKSKEIHKDYNNEFNKENDSDLEIQNNFVNLSSSDFQMKESNFLITSPIQTNF